MTHHTRSEKLKKINEEAKYNVVNKPEPEGQKFPIGSRVKIADVLGSMMSHFPSGVEATVLYTYAHAYPSFDSSATNQYALEVDVCGFCAWFYEHQLTLIEDNHG